MQVPFGKAFCSSLQWYARADSPGRCNLRVSCQVDFTGFVGPLKGLIHRSSMEVSFTSALSPPYCWGPPQQRHPGDFLCEFGEGGLRHRNCSDSEVFTVHSSAALGGMGYLLQHALGLSQCWHVHTATLDHCANMPPASPCKHRPPKLHADSGYTGTGHQYLACPLLTWLTHVYQLSVLQGMREHHQIVLEHLRQATAGKGGSGPPPGASSRTCVAASGAHSKDLTMLPARQRTIIKVLVAALVAMAILVMAVTRFAMELDEELTRSRRALVLVNDTGCALPSLTTLP